MRTRRSNQRLVRLALGLWLGLGFVVSACAKEAPLEAQCPQVPEGLPITEAEMAYLGALRAHHQAADLYESRGDLARAQDELTQALGLARPSGTAGEDAYLDAAGRAASLFTKRGQAEAALELLRRVEPAATRDSFYLGALKMAEGEAHEARSTQLRAQGAQDSAQEADLRALDAYEASQAINGRVLERLSGRQP
jgi:tetratricopeptide (TPR) repeat protein